MRDIIENLAEAAQNEIRSALDSGKDTKRIISIANKWVEHPKFNAGFNSLNITVLNELIYITSVKRHSLKTWEHIKYLAIKFKKQDAGDLIHLLIISCLELIVEPPEAPEALHLLHTTFGCQETKEILLASYTKHPWLLRSHAKKYSNGLITPMDCINWLQSQGYESMSDTEIEELSFRNCD